MIKAKGKIVKSSGILDDEELQAACQSIPDDSEYLFVICDNKKNRNAPYLSFLFAGVLSFLSEALPSHPSQTALYKFFEDMFAPVHTSEIDGKRFQYRDLKNERKNDVNDVIEKIVEYALRKWGVRVPTQEEFASPEYRELYSQAYLTQEADWSNFLSSQKQLSNNERRNQDERV